MRARHLAGVAVIVLDILVTSAGPAWADNCGGIADCVGVLGGALGALGGAVAAAVGGWAASGDRSSDPTPPPPPPPPPPDPAPPAEPPPPVPPVYDPEAPPYDPEKIKDAGRQVGDDIANGKGPGDWVKNINPYKNEPGGDNNCAEAAKAVDRTLGGHPSAAPPTSDGLNRGELQDDLGRRGQTSTIDQITRQVQEGGPGTRGMVVVFEGGDSHVFNVVNMGGNVTFIDGQQGTVNSSGNGMMRADGFTPGTADVHYIPTYP